MGRREAARMCDLHDTRELGPSRRLRALRNTSASSRSSTQSHRWASRKTPSSRSSTSQPEARSLQEMGNSGRAVDWATASAVAVLPTPGSPWSMMSRPPPLLATKSCVYTSAAPSRALMSRSIRCRRRCARTAAWIILLWSKGSCRLLMALAWPSGVADEGSGCRWRGLTGANLRWRREYTNTRGGSSARSSGDEGAWVGQLLRIRYGSLSRTELCSRVSQSSSSTSTSCLIDSSLLRRESAHVTMGCGLSQMSPGRCCSTARSSSEKRFLNPGQELNASAKSTITSPSICSGRFWRRSRVLSVSRTGRPTGSVTSVQPLHHRCQPATASMNRRPPSRASSRSVSTSGAKPIG